MLQPIPVTDVRLNSLSPLAKDPKSPKQKKRVQFTPASIPPLPPPPPLVCVNRNSPADGGRAGSKETEDSEEAACYPDSEDGETSKGKRVDLATFRT